MQRLRKLHKFAGLSAGLLLFILAVTGFLLDHRNWSWLYTVHLPNAVLPQSVIEIEGKLLQAKYDGKEAIYVATLRGLYEKKPLQEYHLVLDIPATELCFDPRSNRLFVSTYEGIYVKDEYALWQPFALQNRYVNAMSLSEGRIFASVDRKRLYTVDIEEKRVLSQSSVAMPTQKEAISLGRFIRDLHYGRGLFDDSWSLWINDLSGIMLALLAISGYILSYVIKRVKNHHSSSKRYLKPLIHLHGNFLTIIMILPLFILALTGVILNHYDTFSRSLKSTAVGASCQTPIYQTLREDIWSVDIDRDIFRIGNRLGVYESKDLSHWQLVSKGFAYKMVRLGQELYVSGMGSSNRLLRGEKSWQNLMMTPHMFRSVSLENGETVYTTKVPIVMNDTSVYSLVLALHDGTFFAPWWRWVYDIAALLLLILFFTGTVRYLKKKKIFSSF